MKRDERAPSLQCSKSWLEIKKSRFITSIKKETNFFFGGGGRLVQIGHHILGRFDKIGQNRMGVGRGVQKQGKKSDIIYGRSLTWNCLIKL